MNDLESRDQIIADLTARLEAAEAEVEHLEGQLDNQECDTTFWKERATKAAEQERAAVVAWIKRKICQYMEEGKALTPGSTTRKLWDEHVVALSCVGASIEEGEHWLEDGELKGRGKRDCLCPVLVMAQVTERGRRALIEREGVNYAIRD